MREFCVHTPSAESCLVPSAPQGHLAASKVWLGDFSTLHSQQLKGPLLPRLHRATWQQVEIPETCLSQGLQSPRDQWGCRSPAPALLVSLAGCPPCFGVWRKKD